MGLSPRAPVQQLSKVLLRNTDLKRNGRRPQLPRCLQEERSVLSLPTSNASKLCARERADLMPSRSSCTEQFPKNQQRSLPSPSRRNQRSKLQKLRRVRNSEGFPKTTIQVS